MKADAEAGLFPNHAGLLVDRAGLPRRRKLINDAEGYLRRTRRGRSYGLIGGLVFGAGLGWLAGGTALLVWLPGMLAGYVLGLLLSEYLGPRRDRPAHRAAELRVRRTADLLPRWARLAAWVLFVPVLASPLLALIRPVHGLTRVSTATYTCVAGGGLSPLPALVASAVIGATGLLAARLALYRLVRRPRPADDPDAARLDDLLRGISARAVAGGAAALALTLVSVILGAVMLGAVRHFCPAQPGPMVPAYPWLASAASWLRWASYLLLAAAVVILVVCRRDLGRGPDPGAAR